MNCQLIVLPILDDSFHACVSCDCLYKLMHLHKINLCVFSQNLNAVVLFVLPS